MIFLMAAVHREVEESGLRPNYKEVVAKTDSYLERISLSTILLNVDERASGRKRNWTIVGAISGIFVTVKNRYQNIISKM